MKACDIDDGREDVESVAVLEYEGGAPLVLEAGDGLDSGTQRGGVSAIIGFDACGPCREAITAGGLAVLVERYAEAHRPKRRRAAKPLTAPGTTTA